MSLIELLIAINLSLIITAGALFIFSHILSQFIKQQSMVHTQENLILFRVVMEEALKCGFASLLVKEKRDWTCGTQLEPSKLQSTDIALHIARYRKQDKNRTLFKVTRYFVQREQAKNEALWIGSGTDLRLFEQKENAAQVRRYF